MFSLEGISARTYCFFSLFSFSPSVVLHSGFEIIQGISIVEWVAIRGRRHFGCLFFLTRNTMCYVSSPDHQVFHYLWLWIWQFSRLHFVVSQKNILTYLWACHRPSLLTSFLVMTWKSLQQELYSPCLLHGYPTYIWVHLVSVVRFSKLCRRKLDWKGYTWS